MRLDFRKYKKTTIILAFIVFGLIVFFSNFDRFLIFMGYDLFPEELTNEVAQIICTQSLDGYCVGWNETNFDINNTPTVEFSEDCKEMLGLKGRPIREVCTQIFEIIEDDDSLKTTFQKCYNYNLGVNNPDRIEACNDYIIDLRGVIRFMVAIK